MAQIVLPDGRTVADHVLWRALALEIKAKLEAVETGIAIFEQEFSDRSSERATPGVHDVTALEIAEIRHRADLSQAQLARHLSVALRTVQNWEQGLRRPRGPAILMLRELAERPRRKR